jgi:hypothetical protein
VAASTNKQEWRQGGQLRSLDGPASRMPRLRPSLKNMVRPPDVIVPALALKRPSTSVTSMTLRIRAIR